MNDLISREEAIAYAISGCTREFEGQKWIRVSEVRESLQTMASAQPEHRWIPGREISRDYIGDTLLNIQYENWRCSNCNCIVEDYRKPTWNYCPNCGVKMEKEKQ